MYRMAHINYLTTAALEQGPVYPWYTSTYLNASTPDPKVGLGALWELEGDLKNAGGNVFMYVRALENLVVGQVVSMVVPTINVSTGTTGTAPAYGLLDTSAQGYVTTNITTTLSDINNLLYVANSTGSGGGTTFKRIQRQSAIGASTAFGIANREPNSPKPMWDADAFPDNGSTTAYGPTSGDVCAVIRPYTVGVNTATTVPCGVALGTVTSGNYTVIQVAGIGLILATGNGTALAAGVPAKGGAAGVVIGTTAGATPYMGGASVIAFNAYSTAGAVVQPFQFNFMGNI